MAAQRLPWLQRHTARCQSSTQTVAQSASVTSAYPKRIAGSLVNWLNECPVCFWAEKSRHMRISPVIENAL
jgi:hypothetical protein